ncbi:hypothetical protein GPECTOR_59g649 [Gonium pectorale]|uniref:Uncharacterized protein n=1 Tax=Gonium pectorale TaxID=33097 RepID=A0A150G5D9_GONPE|nr:hypothetical protein GPECTOR_59g649 [Gonium pectorale]|eukprot:KXZ45041.1 hypothetical protein GPECTOR_59g649 [Gonium pectorale]
MPPGATTTTLFEAVLAASPPGRCLALVQNVHFLPMGPSGTGPRSASLLSAWHRLGGILAVSAFVADYLTRHWPLPPATAGAAAATADGAAAAESDGAANAQADEDSQQLPVLPPQPPLLGQQAREEAGAGAGRPPLLMVPLATWGVFGRPPFPDLAAKARPLLRAWRGGLAASPAPPPAVLRIPPGAVPRPDGVAGAAALGHVTGAAQLGLDQGEGSVRHAGHAGQRNVEQQGETEQPQQQGAELTRSPPRPRVVVAVLKLTPEKGCSIVVELARRLAGCGVTFRVVTGDPAVAAALSPLTAAAAGGDGDSGCSGGAIGVPGRTAPPQPPSSCVEVWEPQPDVGAVLDGCVALLAPSLWLEAWGMVVTESLLRGLPAVVSDLGGLPEAGMLTCPAVPVAPIVVPPDASGTPDWGARIYPPKQDRDAWEQALLGLLLGKRPQTQVTVAADAGTAAVDLRAVDDGHGGGCRVRGGTSKVGRFVSVFRGALMLATCTAILAVDFRTFPRRYAKAETYGTGYMDVGVGGVVLAAGLVSQVAVPSGDAAAATAHVGEYGVHWNFFHTIAVVALLGQVVGGALHPAALAPAAVAVTAAHQAALSLGGLGPWAMSAQRSPDLLSLNKEGLASVTGFWALHLWGAALAHLIHEGLQSVGHHLRPQPASGVGATAAGAAGADGSHRGGEDGDVRSDRGRTGAWPLRARTAAPVLRWWLQLAAVDGLLWAAAVELEKRVEPVSRRGGAVGLRWESGRRATEVAEVELGRAINRNQLAVFLIANVLTGLVNLSVNTLEVGRTRFVALLLYLEGWVPDGTARLLLGAYVTCVCGVALLLDARGWRLRL